MKPIPMVVHIRPDFDVAKMQHSLPSLQEEKTPPHREASRGNPYWKLVHWFLRDKPSMGIS